MDIAGKRILVTGSQGYLGKFLVHRLKSAGAIVFATDMVHSAEERYFCANITDTQQMSDLADAVQPEYIFHLAALINRDRSFDGYTTMESVNVGGTRNLLEALKNVAYENFIFISSSEVYGNAVAPFSETTIPRPTSPYSLTKLYAEHLVTTFSDIYEKPYTNVRLFNFFGPDMPQSFFIPQMLQAFRTGAPFAMTEGEQLRDFLYIDDVTRGLTAIVQSASVIGKTLNLCSGKAVSMRNLALEAKRAFGSTSEIQFGAIKYRNNEVWAMQGDNRQLLDTTGFTAQYSLEDALALCQ